MDQRAHAPAGPHCPSSRAQVTRVFLAPQVLQIYPDNTDIRCTCVSVPSMDQVCTSNTLPMKKSVLARLPLVRDSIDTLAEDRMASDCHLSALHHHPVEAACQETERVFRSLVEKANDAILVIQDGTAVYQNPAHTHLFGSSSDHASHDLFEVIAPEDRERVREYHSRRLRGEAVPDQYELTARAADGRWVRVEVNPSVMEYAGRP